MKIFGFARLKPIDIRGASVRKVLALALRARLCEGP
jgi:hypothetical protein